MFPNCQTTPHKCGPCDARQVVAKNRRFRLGCAIQAVSLHATSNRRLLNIHPVSQQLSTRAQPEDIVIMKARLNSAPDKTQKLASLENSWDGNIHLIKQSRRHARMSEDSRKFMMQSRDGTTVRQAMRSSIAEARKSEKTAPS